MQVSNLLNYNVLRCYPAQQRACLQGAGEAGITSVDSALGQHMGYRVSPDVCLVLNHVCNSVQIMTSSRLI